MPQLSALIIDRDPISMDIIAGYLKEMPSWISSQYGSDVLLGIQ